MKKIGIFTFHKAHNYGALLQAYALQYVLKNNNNTSFIDYNSKIYNNYKVFKPLGRNFLKWPKRIFFNLINYKANKLRYINFNNFIVGNFTMSVNTIDNINSMDILITGSDQVWNPNIIHGFDNNFFLNIGKRNITRISYAASVGNVKYLELYKDDYSKKLNMMDYISIREKGALSNIKSVTNREDIFVALDPTLLLKKDDWQSIINDSIKSKDKYILAYMVEPNNDYYEIVNYLSDLTKIKVIDFENNNIFHKSRINNKLKSAYVEGPLEFLALIQNAEYVITTSFHATVFSILFQKMFWVIPHSTTGSRVNDLLNTLKLENRIVKNLTDFKSKSINENIRYDLVNNKINILRNESIDWLFDKINKVVSHEE